MLWWLIQITLIAALLAGVVAGCCRVFRLGPAARHVLWLLVLVKLVTPPIVSWPWQVPAEVVAFDPARILDEPLPDAIAVSPTVLGDGQVSVAPVDDADPYDNPIVHSELIVVQVDSEEAGTVQPAAADVDVPLPAKPTASRESPWRWMDVAVFVGWTWLAGAVLVLVVQTIRIVRMHRRIARSEPAPDWLVQEVNDLARQLGLRAPPVRVSSNLPTPLLWSLGGTRLLWPERLTDPAAAPSWRGVIVHELAHLKRRDHWAGWIEFAAGCLWWWNPLFWYVRHQVHENAELACDAWVIQTLPEGRRSYAEALLNVCENSAQPTLPVPALGINSGARRNLERRLTMILREHVPFRLSWTALLVAAMLAVLTLPGWSQSKPGAPADTAAETAAEESPDVSTEDVANALNIVPQSPTADADSAAAAEEPSAKSTGSGPSDYGEDFRSSSYSNASPTVRKKMNPQASEIRKLQQTMQSLMREVNRLRAGQESTSTTADTADFQGGVESVRKQWASPKATSGISATPDYQQTAQQQGTHPKKDAPVVEQTETIVLARTTYRLPALKAHALEQFIKQHVPVDVHVRIGGKKSGQAQSEEQAYGDGESYGGSSSFGNSSSGGFGAEGDMEGMQDAYGSSAASNVPVLMTITTTPDAQRVIGQFILLMLGKTTPVVTSPAGVYSAPTTLPPPGVPVKTFRDDVRPREKTGTNSNDEFRPVPAQPKPEPTEALPKF